ncbi:MAG: ABC transporter permease, partial [Sulfuricella sp.]|nr:ABC transporter permease [Sulfuricella sp.]
MSDSSPEHDAAASLETTGEGAFVRCSGRWTLVGLDNLEPGLAQLPWPQSGAVTFDASAIADLDSAGAWLIVRTLRQTERRGCTVAMQGLRPEHDALLRLVREHAADERASNEPRVGFLERLGLRAWSHFEQLQGMLAFLGESTVAMLQALARPARIRWRAILYNLQIAGFSALPIVGLLAFLMGVVIAYQGAGQLARYGANIFVADLVGLSMLREMAPLLTAIVVAGRSGSAYAAQIGTMKVTEEIDALRTIGVSPMDLLVLPKMLALVVALPLLTVYADILGVFGGMIMAQ